jgi:hypothetical protein
MGIWIAMTTDQVSRLIKDKTHENVTSNQVHSLTIPSTAQHSPRHHRPLALRFHLADRFRRLATALGVPQVRAQDYHRTCSYVGCTRDSHSRFYQWRVGTGACWKWDWGKSCVWRCCCACLVGLDGDYVLLVRWEEVVISGRGWGGNVALGDVPKSCNTLWVFTLKSGSLWQLSRLIEWISMYKLHAQSIFNTKATFNNICFLLLVATTTTAATGNHNLGTQFFHEDSLDCT